MFYAHFVLNKKGPLSRIWLAAHWEKKLNKSHVFETNIEDSVDAILKPKVRLALRTTGHLLLGVVRIYSKKTAYLLADCNEAFIKVKMAFRPDAIDLQTDASVAAITLPETFPDFETLFDDDLALPEPNRFKSFQSRPEEITMREDVGQAMVFDDFCDLGFGDGPGAVISEGFDAFGLDLFSDLDQFPSLAVDDKDVKALTASGEDVVSTVATSGAEEAGNDTTLMDVQEQAGFGDERMFETLGDRLYPDTLGDGLYPDTLLSNITAPDYHEPADPVEEEGRAAQDTMKSMVQEQTTLISNTGDAFALDPIDVTDLDATTKRRVKRKRTLIIDVEKEIPSEDMKAQLVDTTQIVTTLDMAPPTRKLMLWKETGGVDQLVQRPVRHMPSKMIKTMYSRNLRTRPVTGDNMYVALDMDEPSVDELQQKAKRRRSSAKESIAAVIEMERFAKPETGRGRISSDEIGPDVNDVSHVNMTASSMDVTTMQDDTMLDPFSQSVCMTAASHELNVEVPMMQQEDETEDQYEERRLKGRSQTMINQINKELENKNKVSFRDLVVGKSRKQVASKFYTLLVLKKLQAVNIKQKESFGDIAITRGSKQNEI